MSEPRTFTPPDRRRLKLHFLHHPRSFEAPRQEWELHHGFRIRVLSRHALALFIGRPPEDSDLLSAGPEPGEDSFLLFPAPQGLSPVPFQEAFEQVRSQGWEPAVTLVLCDDLQCPRAQAMRRQLKRAVPSGHGGLVLWVSQEMPGERWDGLDFFNAEQILHQFGRMGRRVARRMRWRRFLP